MMRAATIVALAWAAVIVAQAQDMSPSERGSFADGLYARGMFAEAAKEYEALLKAAQTNAPNIDAVHFRLGECHRQSGNLTEADRYFFKVFAGFPGSEYRFKAGFRRAEVHYGAGQYAAAADLFQAAISAGPPPDIAAAALYYRGLALLETGKTKEAAESLNQSVKTDEGGEFAPYALLKLGETYAAGPLKNEPGAVAAALGFLKRASEIKDSGRAAAEALFQMGDLYFRNNEFGRSAECYAALAERFAADVRVPEARMQWAWAAHNAGLFTKGLELASGALNDARIDRRSEWLYLKANCERQLMKTGEAVSTYTELLKGEPSDTMATAARYEMAVTLVKKGLNREALEALASMKVPENLRKDVCWLRAEASSGAGDMDQAVQCYRQILTEHPGSDMAPHALYRLGHYRQDLREYDEAAKHYHEVFLRFPAHELADKALFAAASAYEAAGKEADAVAEWGRLLEKYQKSSYTEESLYRKSMGEIRLARMDQALLSLNAIVQGFPASRFTADALFWLGINAAQTGKPAEAEALFRRVLAARPEAKLEEQTRFRLSLVLKATGKDTEAADLLFPLLNASADLRSDPSLLAWLSSVLCAGKREGDAASVAALLADAQGDPAWRQAGFALLGRALLAGGRGAEAARAFEKAVEENASTEYAPEAALRAGQLALTGGDAERAYPYLEKAATLASDDRSLGIRARAYAGMGKTEVLRGRDEEAVRYFLAVALLYDDPDVVPGCLAGAADAYGRMKKPADRHRLLKELAERYPKSPEALALKETP
jgi:TolA-binding protein